MLQELCAKASIYRFSRGKPYNNSVSDKLLEVTTIENEGNSRCLVWKSPERDLVIGDQIIVNESEEALLFENGQLVQVLEAGRHLVESGNIPGIEGSLRRMAGSNSPIRIDTWFINKTVSTNYKWGVQLQAKDNTHGLIVPIGSYGSMLIRIDDPGSFVLQIVGQKYAFVREELRDFLLPIIERNLKDFISKSITNKKLDVFTLDSELMESSKTMSDLLSKDIKRFGISLIDFYIQGIEVIGNNPDYLRIKDSLSEAASLKIRAKAASETKGFYEQERKLDAIDKAIDKESTGIVGSLLGRAGLSQNPGTSSANKSLSTEDLKFKLFNLKDMMDSGLISREEYEQKKKELLGNY